MVKTKNPRRFYVYQLRLENSTTPFYIGKGSRDRFREHFRKTNLEKPSHKNNIIKKATREGIKVLSEILCTGMTEEEALASEAHLVFVYGRRWDGTGCLANLSEGGQGPNGVSHGPQTPEHIAKRMLNRVLPPMTEAHREKLRLINKGRITSEETRLKISEANKGKVFSDEYREKLSIAGKNQQKFVCEHCNDSFTKSPFSRYHGDKCKSNPHRIHVPNKNPKVAGENAVNAKLTDAIIREIRRLVEICGMSKAAVGRLYNIRDSQVCKIISRQSWAHVI